MENGSQSEEIDQRVNEIDYKDKMRMHLRIPFPTVKYAECAMRSLGVDPPFSDTKT